MQPSGPIADLSYRNYTGELASPRFRWWVIAKMGMRLAVKKKFLWFLTFTTGWYYLVMITVLFFVEQVVLANPQAQRGLKSYLEGIVWKDQFLHGFSFSQLLLMLMTLMLGAGTIANDNRANALLVYLSKPCSKLDYALGKWMGVFLPLFGLTLVPTLIFYLYGLMSYRETGFFSEEPWLLPKMVLIVALSAALHSGLILGVSSMSNQGRIAGATYAGLYLMTSFFTKAMQFAWVFSRGEAPDVVKTLYYCSIDGIQIGLAKAILGTQPSNAPFGLMDRGARVVGPIPAPPLLPFLIAALVLMTVGVLVAWRRVRAVEVVE